jgi:hypothetical protein
MEGENRYGDYWEIKEDEQEARIEAKRRYEPACRRSHEINLR